MAKEVLLTASTFVRDEPSTEGIAVILVESSEVFVSSRRLGKELVVEEEPTVKKELEKGQEPATKSAEEEALIGGLHHISRSYHMWDLPVETELFDRLESYHEILNKLREEMIAHGVLVNRLSLLLP
ncbi:uncharacterized protein A4U43_C01F20330 [Asparagus officinalis]|uniref:Uncharacterized protein n=1 Tax=Asparagus officinalis TaxID=4686 RepID=A0A5P1FSL5_ASPOF|nr:uncharacterized protein A4U43_C01F20330 [Asparagus officinalis]